jgi:hypothetical protein
MTAHAATTDSKESVQDLYKLYSARVDPFSTLQQSKYSARADPFSTLQQSNYSARAEQLSTLQQSDDPYVLDENNDPYVLDENRYHLADPSATLQQSDFPTRAEHLATLQRSKYDHVIDANGELVSVLSQQPHFPFQVPGSDFFPFLAGLNLPKAVLAAFPQALFASSPFAATAAPSLAAWPTPPAQAPWSGQEPLAAPSAPPPFVPSVNAAPSPAAWPAPPALEPLPSSVPASWTMPIAAATTPPPYLAAATGPDFAFDSTHELPLLPLPSLPSSTFQFQGRGLPTLPYFQALELPSASFPRRHNEKDLSLSID